MKATLGLLLLPVLLAITASCSDSAPPIDAPKAHQGHQEAAAHTGSHAAPGMSEVDVSPVRRQLTGVRTVPLEMRALTQKLRTVGVVVADERLVRKVQTKVSGWVDRLFVNFTGQYAKAGEPILSIYSPELVATQREYLLALGATRTQSGKAEGKAEQGLLIDSARTRLRYWDLSDSQIRALEESGAPQKSVTLASPISGYITLKPVYQGMYVTPEMELYTVTDLSSVWIWADVYEDEIGLLKIGQTAAITLASAPDRTFAAVASYIHPTLDPATRTLRVHFDVKNPDGALRPGMYATVQIEAPVGEVLALPEDAVIDTGERRIVFVESGEGHYQPRAVRIGRKAEGYYEALEGLSPGDRVVVSAQFLLDSESRLRAASGGAGHGSH